MTKLTNKSLNMFLVDHDTWVLPSGVLEKIDGVFRLTVVFLLTNGSSFNWVGCYQILMINLNEQLFKSISR